VGLEHIVMQTHSGFRLGRHLPARGILIGVWGPAVQLVGKPLLSPVSSEHVVLLLKLIRTLGNVAGVADLHVATEHLGSRVLLASRVGSRHSFGIEPSL
jgi:hypothetical protein